MKTKKEIYEIRLRVLKEQAAHASDMEQFLQLTGAAWALLCVDSDMPVEQLIELMLHKNDAYKGVRL